MNTTDRTIILSGGSRGLGLHLIRELLRHGNRVATFARSATEHTQALTREWPDRYLFEAFDATDEGSLKAFVRKVADKLGPIDGLVNNAAIGQDDLLAHTASDRIRRIVDVNITAPILLTKIVVKRMLLQSNPGRHSVVNITSICGSRGYAGLSAYAASKGALDAFTRAMARELGEADIRFNSVAPGFFASEMSSVLLPEQMDTIRRRTPTGALSSEEDVFAAVDLFLSRKSNIHGQTLMVDGGITI